MILSYSPTMYPKLQIDQLQFSCISYANTSVTYLITSQDAHIYDILQCKKYFTKNEDKILMLIELALGMIIDNYYLTIDEDNSTLLLELEVYDISQYVTKYNYPAPQEKPLLESTSKYENGKDLRYIYSNVNKLEVSSYGLQHMIYYSTVHMSNLSETMIDDMNGFEFLDQIISHIEDLLKTNFIVRNYKVGFKHHIHSNYCVNGIFIEIFSTVNRVDNIKIIDIDDHSVVFKKEPVSINLSKEENHIDYTKIIPFFYDTSDYLMYVKEVKAFNLVGKDTYSLTVQPILLQISKDSEKPNYSKYVEYYESSPSHFSKSGLYYIMKSKSKDIPYFGFVQRIAMIELKTFLKKKRRYKKYSLEFVDTEGELTFFVLKK